MNGHETATREGRMHAHVRMEKAPAGLRATGRGILVGLAVLLAAAACELDLENPNAPTEDEVLGSVDGIVSLAIGMQSQFADQVEEFIQASALTTDEWGTTTRALSCYIVLFTGPGSSYEPTCGTAEEPWAAAYEVIKSANDLIENAPAAGLGANLEAGIVALAHLYKGMAYGMLALNYDRAVIDAGADNPPLEPRDAVLGVALAELEAARSALTGLSGDGLEPLRQRVLAEGFDPGNTVDAMLARYYLVDGQYEQAIAAAERVDPTVLSSFGYTATDRNPVENLMLQLGYTLPLETFAEEAQTGDGRVAFWVEAAAEPEAGNPPETLLLPPSQYAVPTDPFPVYLPDEMALIRAEAHARLGQLDLAGQLVNEVRTQASSPVDEPVANLPALPSAALDTEAELLAAIAYERRYELYLQGLRWDDVRRLGTAATGVEPVLEFLPVPQQECDTNTSANC